MAQAPRLWITGETPVPRGSAVLGIVVLLLSAGCSRAFYRVQADEQVYRTVADHATDPRWPLDGYTIDIRPESRMFDPFCPDYEPMPPDDPTAHRLMHSIDGKRGYPRWGKNGFTHDVDNPHWRSCLPVNENGELVLDMNGAVQMALLQAPDYQEELEDLYLSALDVTFERFRFDTQWFAGNGTFFTTDGRIRGGGESSSTVENATDLQMRRLFTTGGELVVGLANSLVWQFSGPNTHTATTLLDFSLVQPLLRAGGRARVMERLTIAERTLLANVRQMERFRRGFYVEIATGVDAGSGPSRRGGLFGGSGLEGFTGVGSGGFGRVGGFGDGFSGGAGAAEAGGYLGLLQNQQQLRNAEGNVSSLHESTAQLEAQYVAGRIDRFQVDLARQALYGAQSRLLTDKTSYETRLDGFKRQLGLPPDLEVRIDDPLLAPFELIAPKMSTMQQAIADTQIAVGGTIVLLRDLVEPGRERDEPRLRRLLTDLAGRLDSAAGNSRQVVAYFPTVQQDIDRLVAVIPQRKVELIRLADTARRQRQQVDPSLFDTAALDHLPAQLGRDFAALQRRLTATPTQLELLRDQIQGLAAASAKLTPEQLKLRLEALVSRIPDEMMDLANNALELALIQAKARTETVTLVRVEMDTPTAVKIAGTNRRDWMNARAGLVDQWRLIEFNANDLESDLDITFSGDISNTGDNPLRLRDATGRLRAGLEFDAPLTRLGERNIYRQVLIEYQQARRNYYRFVDGINQGLRETIRRVELNKINFQLRRLAMRVAIDQVDLVRLRLGEPPKPGEAGQFGATTARDLVTALTALLDAQNDFLSVWVNYEVLRRSLDFNLGTMQLDHTGIWIDPGEIDPKRFGADVPDCE